MKNKKFALFPVIACVLQFVLLFPTASKANADTEYLTAEITIDAGQEIGPVNRLLFGNNFLGYDPGTVFSRQKYYGLSYFGEGVWDPTSRTPVKEVMALARAAGISAVRFPGGCGSHRYDWKKAIGPNRQDFFFGIDEFLKTVGEISAEPVFTVSYFLDGPESAADFVEYLNAENDGGNPGGGTDWALERAKNGHPKPYRVKYFEIGNEVWHGDHLSVREVSGKEYAQRYLQYYAAMKAVDPTIKVGVVTFSHRWNRDMLDIVKGRADFAILHTYPSPEVKNYQLEKMNAADIFYATYTRPVAVDEFWLREFAKLSEEKTGRRIPIIVSEYNGGFVQDKPVGYRHALGTALLNAELLRIFMKPEHNILMANYWNFVNEYWGMARATGNFMAHNYAQPIKYVKRPNFYVFEMYNDHFGDTLIKASAQSPLFEIPREDFKALQECVTRHITETPPEKAPEKAPLIPFLTVNASKDKNNKKLYLMVVNRQLETEIAASITLSNFTPSSQAKAWILNGPSVSATNEIEENNVSIHSKIFDIEGPEFSFSFEPHSLTAIEIVEKD